MAKPTGVASNDILHGFVRFCERVGTQYAASVIRDVHTHGAFEALQRDPPAPKLYSDARTFALDWCVYNLLRKFPGLEGSTESVRLRKAVSGWKAAEQSCARTNEWIRSWMSGQSFPVVSDGSLSGASLILQVQHEISRILGPFDRKALLAECRWSGGATALTKRGLPLSAKITQALHCTPRALKWARYVVSRDPVWCEAILNREVVGPVSILPDCFTVVRSSRTVPVPKTAYTERTIAAEPALNGFLQQGVGRWLRSRLKKWGCDLDDQSCNQRAAAEAVTRGYSTLDLESASDTVSFELVRLLFPERWFSFLSDLRSPYTDIGGKSVRLEKFSSMGNAFTFELESLIFLAIVRAVNRLTGARQVSCVYGDDIVCPRESAHAVLAALELFGFKPNKSKSFLDGPFFESCGKHYFCGTDVTPVYITKVVDSVFNSIRLHNKLLRWSVRVDDCLLNSPVKGFLKGIHFPKRDLYRQPFGDGDLGYIVPREEVDVPFCPNRGFRITGLAPRVGLDRVSKEVALYAYKLRRPSYSNSHPKGWAYEVGRDTVVPTVRWVPQWHFAGFTSIETCAP